MVTRHPGDHPSTSPNPAMCVKRETIKIETKMKKQMKRTVYEAPVTELFRVELEGTFMTASVVNDKTTSGVETTEQEVTIVDGSQWDNDGWE